MNKKTMTESYLSQVLPRGAGALFLIQIFATLAFAVLYSTLVLYTTQRLRFHAPTATAVIGSFMAFNYGLHILGGYMGGRLFSWRGLFVVGMFLQVVGCTLISIPVISDFYWGLSFFLVGSGLNVTCINMMVTQLFEPEDKSRESAFMWNYSGMNIGFFIGFSIAGYFQLQQNFHTLFLVAAMGNVIAFLFTLVNWPKLKDRKTVLLSQPRKKYALRMLGGTVLIALMLLVLKPALEQADFSNAAVVVIACFITLGIVVLAFRQGQVIARQRIWAFLVFAAAALVFWSLYQLAPMGLTLFAEYNVNRHYLGLLIPPQWIQNINTVIIAFGGPTFAYLFRALRARGYQFSLPLQFSIGLLAVGLGLAILPLGIYYANAAHLVNFNWILASYILQSLGELFIGPVGYAMIGQLAPRRLQGIFMGSWMMYVGVAGVFSSYASNFAIGKLEAMDPVTSNPHFSQVFGFLGGSAIIAAGVLLLLVPWLRRMIKETINGI